MVCPRRLSFSQFVILMSTTNGEKDSLLGQTVLPPELGQISGLKSADIMSSEVIPEDIS